MQNTISSDQRSHATLKPAKHNFRLPGQIYATYLATVRARDLKCSENVYLPPHVTCHMSHVIPKSVMFHMSHVTFFLFFFFFGWRGLLSTWRVYYQWGLPRLVSSKNFKRKTCCLLFAITSWEDVFYLLIISNQLDENPYSKLLFIIIIYKDNSQDFLSDNKKIILTCYMSFLWIILYLAIEIGLHFCYHYLAPFS